MVKQPKRGTTTVEAVLGILSMGPMTGYEIRQQVERSIGNFWSESFGQIYPALTRLRKQGLVQAEVSGKAGRKVYSLTAPGSERLRAWLRVMPAPRRPRDESLLKLFFGGLGELRDVREQVSKTKERFAADLARYEAMEPVVRARQAGSKGLPFYLMTLEYGMAEAAAAVAWADRMLAQIDAMEQERSKTDAAQEER